MKTAGTVAASGWFSVPRWGCERGKEREREKEGKKGEREIRVSLKLIVLEKHREVFCKNPS